MNGSTSPAPRRDSEFIPVGRVGRPHGLIGAFVVEAASDDPERLAEGARVYVYGEPATILESKRARRRPVIRLDRAVERGTQLEVPREELPPAEEHEYYAFQLRGLIVEEEGGRTLGTVAEVAPGVANDVLELDSGILLPLVDACVRAVDLEHRRILVAPGFADAG
jgi:16S rRNA processing protein RimM